MSPGMVGYAVRTTLPQPFDHQVSLCLQTDRHYKAKQMAVDVAAFRECASRIAVTSRPRHYPELARRSGPALGGSLPLSR